ncbi:hypothetical protein OJF2_50650 [Aquisphaera giovannonii]|uniref:Uncharacterized protein n=2 Tax=Aquisphaera giovannonii TaxID=406548 RepID=A0A5B9W8Y4_9BACT|nr:hypothetical protein OJF2_50650 [Aquisphaera giovannonii]
MNPIAPQQLQQMAMQEGNRKLALAMSVLSVVMVGTMVFRELKHCVQEQIREHDRNCEHSGGRCR